MYTNIIKPNLVGDSYVKVLTTLRFPSSRGHHTFDFHFYRPVVQSFIGSITNRLVTKFQKMCYLKIVISLAL